MGANKGAKKVKRSLRGSWNEGNFVSLKTFVPFACFAWVSSGATLIVGFVELCFSSLLIGAHCFCHLMEPS